MDKETYERQKAFAGEKKPSMQRRCVGHDYTMRQMYMVTMVTEGRRPLFGEVVGNSEAENGSSEAPRVVLTALGQRVEACWQEIAVRWPQIKLVALQLMPDHLHGILFVKEQIDVPLGKVLLGFKQGCNKAYRELVPSVAVIQQQTGQQQTGRQQTGRQQTGRQQTGRNDRYHGLLFAPGFNDKLLLRQGQLQRWLDYLHDNPRRLLMKREHPDLFRVQRGLTVGTQQFSAIGNRFLLDRPVKLQVQCSRRLTDQQIEAEMARLLALARKGAVLVSPSISPGEKRIMRAAFDEGLPLIILQENGFTDLAKPGGQRMDACARGQLLLLAPWDHHNERLTIRRDQCLTLNDLACMICEQ